MQRREKVRTKNVKGKEKKWTSHAGALALVGWYLMLPQMMLQETKDSAAFGLDQWTIVVDKSVPLARWSLFASFDSAAECEAMQAKLLALPNLKTTNAMFTLLASPATIRASNQNKTLNQIETVPDRRKP